MRKFLTLLATLTIVSTTLFGFSTPASAQAHPSSKGEVVHTYFEARDYQNPAFTHVTVSADALWQFDGVGFNFDDLTVEMRSNFGCELCLSVDTLKIVALPPSGPVTKWSTSGPNLTHSYSFSCGTGGPSCQRTWDLSSAGGYVNANTETARVVLIGAIWNPSGPHNDITITVPICRPGQGFC